MDDEKLSLFLLFIDVGSPGVCFDLVDNFFDSDDFVEEEEDDEEEENELLLAVCSVFEELSNKLF